MKISLPPLPRVSDHGSEIALFAVIAIGVLIILGIVASRRIEGWDVAACLLVLQSIVSAVKERWTQRSVDRMGASLANSPPAEPPTLSPDQKQ